MAVDHAELELRSADGTRLSANRWRPTTGVPRAEVLAVPGYADHAARYRELGHHFASRELGLVALDMRGHGNAEGRRGYVETWSDYFDDIDAGVAALEVETRFAFAHSMGALVMLEYLADDTHGFRGLAITNPLLALAMKPPTYKLVIGRLVANVWPTLAMPSGIDPTEISNDPEVAEAYRRDPKVFKTATAGWFQAALAAQARVTALETIATPLWFGYSTADKIVSPAANERMANTLQVEDKTIWVHEGARHEMINEVDRAKVHARIAAWILERC